MKMKFMRWTCSSRVFEESLCDLLSRGCQLSWRGCSDTSTQSNELLVVYSGVWCGRGRGSLEAPRLSHGVDGRFGWKNAVEPGARERKVGK